MMVDRARFDDADGGLRRLREVAAAAAARFFGLAAPASVEDAENVGNGCFTPAASPPRRLSQCDGFFFFFLAPPPLVAQVRRPAGTAAFFLPPLLLE